MILAQMSLNSFYAARFGETLQAISTVIDWAVWGCVAVIVVVLITLAVVTHR